MLRQIGDNCTVDDDCSYAIVFSHCDVMTSTCVCNSGRHTLNYDNTSCFLRKINDKCSIDSDCSDAVANSYCDVTSCKCKSGYYVTSNGTTCTKRRITDECYLTSDCSDAVTNSYCHRDPPDMPTTSIAIVETFANRIYNYTFENEKSNNLSETNFTSSETYQDSSGLATNFGLDSNQSDFYNFTDRSSPPLNTTFEESRLNQNETLFTEEDPTTLPGLNQNETGFDGNGSTTEQSGQTPTDAFRDKRSASRDSPDNPEGTESNMMQFRPQVIIENMDFKTQTPVPSTAEIQLSTDIPDSSNISEITELTFENDTMISLNQTLQANESVSSEIENNTLHDNFTLAPDLNDTEITTQQDVTMATSVLDAPGQCTCLSGYRIGYNGTTCIKRVIGDDCYLDSDCFNAVKNSSCSNITFFGQTFHVCLCGVGLKATVNRSECVPRLIGESCGTNLDCSSVWNSTCSSNTYLCECEQAFYPSQDNTTCILRKVGDHCELDTQCSSAVENSECSSGNCDSNNNCQTRDRLGSEANNCSNSRKVCSCLLGYHSKHNGTVCEKRESHYMNMCGAFC